jgi:hypothetical protein
MGTIVDDQVLCIDRVFGVHIRSTGACELQIRGYTGELCILGWSNDV